MQETGAREITDEEAEPIWQAYLERYQAALLQHSDDPMSGLFTPMLDQAFLTEDEKTAVLWLALQDQNGYILHTEPGGLVLARLSEDGWRTILPADEDWETSLAELPEDLIPAGLRADEYKLEEQSPNAPIWGAIICLMLPGHPEDWKAQCSIFTPSPPPWDTRAAAKLTVATLTTSPIRAISR